MWKKNLFFICATYLCAFFVPAAFADTGAIGYEMQYVSQFGSFGTGNGEFNNPNSVIVGPDERLYVADRLNSRIQVFDKDFNHLATFGNTGPGAMNNVVDLAFDANGNIVASDSNNFRLTVYDPNSYAYIGEITGMYYPQGILKVGSSLYVNEYPSQHLAVIDSSGTITGYFGNYPEIEGSYDITQTSNGNLYVVSNTDGKISVYDSSFNYVSSFGNGILYSPTGISHDSFDNIYVLDSQHNRIVVFDKAGNQIYDYGTQGTGDGEFYVPSGITVDSNGQIYVAEGYDFNNSIGLNHRIQKLLFTSTETFSASLVAGDQNATTDYAILKLENSGSFDDDLLGYDDLVIDGNWSLGGTNSFDSSLTTISNSALTIPIGGSLAVSTTTLGINFNLKVNGTFSATNGLTLTSGGILNGNGTINADTIINNTSTIAPGNSIGTLTINGDYTHSAGAIYQVEVNDAAQSDRIIVNGNVTLSGGTVDVQAAPGNYGFSNNYTILTTTGTITGTFSNVTSNLAFLTPSLVYNANNIQLLLSQNGNTFSDVAETSNQHEVSSVLDTVLTSGTSDATSLDTAFSNLTVDQTHEVLDQIAPDEIASLQQTRVQFTNTLNNIISRRIDALGIRYFEVTDIGNTTANFNDITTASGNNQSLRNRNAWMQGTATKNFKNGDQNAAGYQSTITATRGGIDTEITPDLIIGFSPAYARANIDFTGEADKAAIDYYRGDVYGLYNTDFWTFSAMLGAGLGKQKTSRVIDTGIASRTASGSSEYKDISMQIGGEMHIPLENDFYLKPGWAIATGWMHQDSFTETGADTLNLHYRAENRAFVQFSPKITIGKSIDLEKSDMTLSPYVGTGVIIRPGSKTDIQHAGFSNTPDTDFSVSSARNAPVSFEVSAGFMLNNSNDIYKPTTQVNYNGIFNATENNHSVTATLNWDF